MDFPCSEFALRNAIVGESELPLTSRHAQPLPGSRTARRALRHVHDRRLAPGLHHGGAVRSARAVAAPWPRAQRAAHPRLGRKVQVAFALFKPPAASR